MADANIDQTVPECLFCQIVAGQLPSESVGGTENTIAFRDIAPAAPLHVLVVPKVHITDADSLKAEHAQLLAEMFMAARAIAKSNGVSDSGYRLVFNVGKDAMNSVPHLHLHVLGGRKMDWPPG